MDAKVAAILQECSRASDEERTTFPEVVMALAVAGVESAVRAIQAGMIRYGGFCERVLRSGCAGWTVSILGRRVVYYGRSGDSHTEWFPGAR